MLARADNFLKLSVYLIDSSDMPSDMPSIYALAKDMAVSFPQLRCLYLLFEHRCEIVSFLLSMTITAPDLKGISATTGD